MKYRKITKTERDWIRNVQLLFKNAPSGLFMFVGESMVFYSKDKSGKPYYNNQGSVDQNADSISINTNIHFDGGAY